MKTGKNIFQVMFQDRYGDVSLVEWFWDEEEATEHLNMISSDTYLHEDSQFYFLESGTDNGYDHSVRPTCRGCETVDAHPRYDAYGIDTGHYCDDCYENNYPYRKDRYPTAESDAECGEWLDPEPY